MSELDELIKAADRLCDSLQKAADNQKIFCHNVQSTLDVISWDVQKSLNELKGLKEWL